MREDVNTHGVRGGSPPKGGEPHHPHGGFAHGGKLTIEETLTLHDGEPMHWWAWDAPRPNLHGLPGGSALAINRNITGLPAVTCQPRKDNR